MTTRRRRSFTRKAPVRYAWLPSRQSIVATGSGVTTSGVDLLAAMNADMGREPAPGMVIERIIGQLSVRATAETASSIPITCGIRLVEEGSTALLVTLDTEVARWLWWYGTMVNDDVAEQSAGVFRPVWGTHIPFDVHGRWRLTNVGDELRFTIANHDAEDAILWSLWTRTLVRIP